MSDAPTAALATSLHRRWGGSTSGRAPLAVAVSVCAAPLLAVAGVIGPPQLVLAVVLVLALLVFGSPSAWLMTSLVVASGSGLLRRLLAGSSGRIDNDPLVVLPFVLMLAAFVLSPARLSGDGKARSSRDWSPLFALIPTVILASITVTGRFSTLQLYAAMTQTAVWLVIIGIYRGRIPNVWPAAQRALPIIALVAGTYGIVQFLVLPDWDMAWMISSDLTSIGRPEPFQVRIFGMSESPGPFAALLGIGIIGCTQRAISGQRSAAPLWVLSGLALIGPLVLTGVRLAILALAASILFLGFRGATGIRRFLPLIFLVATGGAVSEAVARFGGSSSILTSDRLTQFNASTDGSLQARIGLLDRIPAALSRPFGSTDGEARLDNLVFDVLANYGPLAALLVVSALVVVSGRVLRAPAGTPHADSAGASVVFLLVFSLGANLFISSTGVVAALAIGAVMQEGANRSEGAETRKFARGARRTTH